MMTAVSNLSREFRASISLFVEMTFAAVALAVIFTTIFYQFGLPADFSDLLLSTITVALLVSVPMAAIASQHSYSIKIVNNKLSELASTDDLTGLLNRRAFTRILEDELNRINRTKSASAICAFDLDHFKAVNDKHGHAFGDATLVHISELIHKELRGPFDKVCRWGGEEFVVLLSDVDTETLRLIVERLRRKIEASPIVSEGVLANLTASFGACLLKPGDDLTAVLEHADAALYLAKANGRNCVEIAEPKIGAGKT